MSWGIGFVRVPGRVRRRAFAVGAIGLMVIGAARASTYTGPVAQVLIATASSGGTRVSIQVSGTTSCSGSGGSWYAFEYSSDTGPGRAWLAALLTAKTAGQSITISGAGTCDQYNIETVLYTNST